MCVELLRRRTKSLVDRLAAHDPADLRLSVVTLGELPYGALESERSAANLASVRLLSETFSVLPFDAACAQR